MAMRILAGQQNSRLPRDLREHRRADMAFGAGARDEQSELVDPVLMPGDPFVDLRVELRSAQARQELDAQLLEVAGEAGGEQPLPLVRGHEARDLLLRPVEPERLAEP